ncbi:MAG: DUF4430 domain-containing protein [Eubacteriales bacterium]|nr:DUF4430 domain-containing protein [Eubacteriales bacterium]
MQKEQKNTKKVVISVVVLLVVVAALLCVYLVTKGTTNQGEKALTIEIVHKDGTTKTFEVKTEREYLGEVLKDEKLVDGEESTYGLFITTADGETADDTNQEWWCLTKGGEQLNTSADQTPIADGETYEITLTVGY